MNDPAAGPARSRHGDPDPAAGVEIEGTENILTLQLLQQTVGFSPAVVDATSRWWEQTASDGQCLPRFLTEQGVFRVDAVETIEAMARGELSLPDAQDLFTLYGLDSLKRCLSAHSARSPAAAHRPRPRRVPRPTVRSVQAAAASRRPAPAPRTKPSTSRMPPAAPQAPPPGARHAASRAPEPQPPTVDMPEPMSFDSSMSGHLPADDPQAFQSLGSPQTARSPENPVLRPSFQRMPAPTPPPHAAVSHGAAGSQSSREMVPAINAAGSTLPTPYEPDGMSSQIGSVEMMLDETLEPLEPGARLGKCLISAELGRGANSTVFRALHTTLGLQVALKVLLAAGGFDAETMRVFAREARILAKLDHPSIVRVLDFDPEPPYPHLVLECVDGLSLKELLLHTGCLTPRAVLSFVSQIAKGLAHATEIGVIHRDIKPGNILMGRDGRAKLADLGLAKVIRRDGAPYEQQFFQRTSAGTPAYISPEQVIGSDEIDFRSDIYSLGATAYQALTGRLPFEHSDFDALMKAHLRQRATPPHEVEPTVPKSLSAMVIRMMNKQPPDRHGSYDELLYDIKRIERELDEAGSRGSKKGRRGGVRGLFGV